MIYIVNYGAGNILSIASAISEINRKFEIIQSPIRFNSTDILLIPGVGNFKSASKQLVKQGFGDLNTQSPGERPFVIGICLGMQILFENSSEGGSINPGLGLLRGNVRSIQGINKSSEILRTNIGWANYEINKSNSNPTFTFLDHFKNQDFYYVHSYMCIPSDQETIKAWYSEKDIKIPSIVESKDSRVLGFQFHPEKSGITGLKLLDETFQAINRDQS